MSPITLTGNLSFGNVTVNQTANSTLSIKNNASNTVTMSVAVPSWLTANATGNFTLAGNATRNVTVTFRPTSEGNFTGNITATSSVGNAIISASGAGVHTRIIGLSGNLSFGNLGVNATATRNLTITNTGSGNLTITGISSSNASFVLTGNTTNLVVGPGGNRTIGVVFQPASAGNLTGSITVNSTATSGNSSIATSGTGVLVPVITGNLSASGVVGGNFSYQITASNNPASFGNATALPAGLSLNAITGLISGTPTIAGNVTANITATNAGGTGSAALTFLIAPSRIISLSGNLSFGSIAVNATANRTLSIRNSGNGNLTVNSISFPEGFSGNWSAGTINASATQNITVSFRPTAAGNFTGSITVNSTATSGNSTIATSGTGVLTPVITSNLSASGVVGGNFSYQITASNNPISFGNVTALPAGLSLNATTGLISGKPTAPFTGNITLSATNAGGNGTANLTVAISPSRIIALSGNLSFGNATVNGTFTRNLTITNTGTGPLNVSGISYPPGFIGNWSGTINATASRNVPVFFRPTSEGPFNGTITVNSNATSGNSTISASGTGVHTRIIALSGDLAFGSALANRTLDKNPIRALTISNSGTGNLTVTRIERPAGFRVFASLPDPSLGGNYTTVNFTYSDLSFSLAELTGDFTLPIAAGSSENLLVAFSPTAATSYSGNITVASNASNAAGNSARAASGTGVTSPLNLLSITGNLSFGNVTVNQQAQRTLSITNLDTESHELAFDIGAGFSVEFSPFPYNVMGNPVTLQAGATVNATVTFSPTSVQAYSGNLSITSVTLGNKTIPATGTATHSRVIGLSGNLSFGNATVNSTITQNLAITNTGTSPLNVTGITYNTAGFSGNWSGGTIAANATQNFTISFRPTSEGNFTGNITVTSNATSGPSTIAASGTGIHSRIMGLSGNLSFGTLTVNQTANRTLSIRNTGTGPLSVTGISYPAGISGNWSSGTIPPNSTQNVTITFRPLEEQLYDGNITINSTATSGPSTIAASGAGIHSRVIGLSGNLSFGGLTITQTANRTLSISNAGTGNFTVNSISLPAGFSGNWSGTISPKTTQNVTITFSPLVEKIYTGNITINSTATSGVSAIAASGTGTPTHIIGLTGNLSFGGQTVNQIATSTLSIRNTGTGPLNVTGINYPTGFSGNWSSGTIAANATQNVTVSFRPTSEGNFTANITVNSTATSGTPTIAASGTGIHSRIMGLSGNLSFGTLTVNQTANRTLSISNTGTGPLSITSINYPTGFSGNWSSGTINPNTTQNVTITFRPLADQAYTGNITINSTATSGVSAIAASGSGAHSRIIGLTGNLSFGNLTVYRAANRTLSISNTGTGNLTVNSISFPAGFSGNWSGTIAPGATQNVTVLFTPTVAQTNPMVGQSYSGNATVVSDATIGSGVRAVSGVAAVPVTAMVAVSGGALPSTTVSTFQIGKYEVTWDEWKAVRGWAVANGYTDLANVGDVQGATTSTEKDSYGSFPVDNVSWVDVVKWCNAKSEMEKLTPVYQVNGATYKTGNEATVSLLSNANGYRLPSEPEWEWAARGGNSTKGFIYSGNNTADVVAWHQSNSDGVTKSVGTKKSNELGIFDMSGNVWEWCWDEVDPGRPIRGGSIVEGASAAVVTYRPDRTWPDNRSNFIGFRLVRGSGVIAPAISHPGRTDGQMGFPYTYQIQAKNKPTSYGATPLPAGLSINATTGLISGTPTVAGLFTANLTASNAGGTNKNNMLFHIAPPMNQIISLPSSISFGNRKLNETATLTLNIINPGSESLYIQLISYPSGSVFSGESYPITLRSAGSNDFKVYFKPTQATSYTGNITVQFSTNLNSISRVFSVNIPVRGSGTP